MKTIVFASWNSKKAIEMQRMTPDGIELLCLKDFPEHPIYLKQMRMELHS